VVHPANVPLRSAKIKIIIYIIKVYNLVIIVVDVYRWCGTVAECGSLDVDHVSVGRFSPQTLYLCFGIGTASERPRFSDVRCCIWLYVFSIISM
jgi:hypothetical protein